METLDDFEMHFYDGGEKFVRSSTACQYVDRFGKVSDDPSVAAPQMLWQHYQQCHSHCVLLESTLRQLPIVDGTEVFPNIAGRRPGVQPTRSIAGTVLREHSTNNVVTPPITPSTMQSFAMSTGRSQQQPQYGRVMVPGIGMAVKVVKKKRKTF